MVFIVHYLHYSVSPPSILFAGLFLLTPLTDSSHLVPKGCSYLVSCLGKISGCAGMVQSTGYPMSPAVALWFSILNVLILCCYLCGWCFCLVCTCSARSWLKSTKIISCAWIRIWDNVRLTLVRFAIVLLSYIATYASDCSSSTVLTWASVSCVWFADSPYPWATYVDFLRIW